MIKQLLWGLVLMVFSLGVYAGQKPMNSIEHQHITHKYANGREEYMGTVKVLCIRGYSYLNSYQQKYSIHTNNYAVAFNTIQMFEERDGKSLPVKCM